MRVAAVSTHLFGFEFFCHRFPFPTLRRPTFIFQQAQFPQVPISLRQNISAATDGGLYPVPDFACVRSILPPQLAGADEICGAAEQVGWFSNRLPISPREVAAGLSSAATSLSSEQVECKSLHRRVARWFRDGGAC